ncbi:MAG: nuclear transport factor 2 family protein [Betaproteobacteria bacterium]
MDKQTPSLAAEIETMKKIYAAINRNDIPAAITFFDPQIEWIEPTHYSGGGGTFRGHADVMAKFLSGRNSWAEGSCNLEGFTVAGDKIVVFVHALVRLKGHTDWIDGRFADVWTFRDGKAIQGRSFGERQEALDWAGAKASDKT